MGKRIKQRFPDESGDPESCTWLVLITEFLIKLIALNDGEEEVCYFDLIIDFLNGDIVLLS